MNKLKIVKIKDFLELITDYHSNGSYETLKKNVQLLEKEDYAVVIRTLNFERNDFKKELLYITEKAYNFLKKSYVLPNDILMNKISNAGSIYLMPNIKKPVTCGMNLFVLRFNNKVNQRYMFYNMKNVEEYIKSFSHGTTTTTITKEEVKNIVLHIHNRKEQDKIEYLLTALDKKIELNNKINSELEVMAKTIYDYWFLQFEFPNEEGKPYKSSGGKMVWNDELKKEISEGWEIKKVKDFLEVITGKEDANHATIKGIYPFFTCSNDILRCDDYKFEGKAILIAGNGDFNIKYYEGKFNVYQRTYVLIPNKEENVGLIYLSSLKTLQKFKAGANGSIVKFITKSDVENIDVYDSKNQIDISIFNKILGDIIKNRKENQELASLRDFLLPLLMNGQVGFKEK